MFIFVSRIEPLDVSIQGTDLDGVLFHDEWIWRAQTGRRASNILQYFERSKEGKIAQAKSREGTRPSRRHMAFGWVRDSGANSAAASKPQTRGYLWGGFLQPARASKLKSWGFKSSFRE